MSDNPERKILDMVEKGQISPEEGLRLINAMKGSHASKPVDEPAVPAAGEKTEKMVPETLDSDGQPAELTLGANSAEAGTPYEAPAIPEEELKRMKRLKRWWVLPFGLGLLVTVLGAIWMYMGYVDRGFGFGFWMAWLPFLLGIFVMVVSFQTSRSVWVHVRIKQKPGSRPQNIAISIPLPVNLGRWFFNTFGEQIPGLKDQPVGDIGEILDSISPEEPFYVHVNDEDGEEVEVFIG